MNPWRSLSVELDHWQAAERVATFWWRDDDAVASTPALARLITLHGSSGVAPALASIPAHARDDLAAKLEHYPAIAVLQHGYAHDNHAIKGERAIELGGKQRREQIVADLEKGWCRLRCLFAERLLPVMVPPWNRIAPELLPHLPTLGFRTLSCFAARSGREAVTGLAQANCHADLVDWRAGRRFRGEERTIAQICSHLEARRSGRADAEEATGILSHHLVHDAAGWRFLETLLERCSRHPGARWLEPQDACLLG